MMNAYMLIKRKVNLGFMRNFGLKKQTVELVFLSGLQADILVYRHIGK